MTKKASKTQGNGMTPAEAILTGNQEDDKAAAILKTISYLSTLEDAQRHSVGTVWNLPDQYREWRVVRLDASTSTFAATRHRLTEMGYLPCPTGVRMMGYDDNDGILYLMCPPETTAALKDWRKAAHRKVADGLKSTVQHHVSALQAMLGSGGTAEIVESRSGHGDASEARDIFTK